MALTYELPIGVVYGQGDERKILKDFSLKSLSVRDLKDINNEQLKSDHPLKWLARTLCTVTESIGGIPVASAYSTSKQFPDVIKRLSLLDASYLLVAGHVHSLGPDVEGFKTMCPCPNNKTVEFNFRLDDVETPELSDDLTPDKVVEVELERGFEFRERNAEDINMKGKIWKKYIFRLPTIADALSNESHFSTGSKSTFGERVMAACLLQVETEEGEVMDASFQRMLGPKLILDLMAYDLKLINKAYNSAVPSMRLTAPSECSFCNREIDLPVDPNFLYVAS